MVQKHPKLKLKISYGSPGSGKTLSLLQRVGQLAEIGVPSSRVLVLSPNRLAAGSMRDQILLSTHWASDSDLARTLQSVAYEVLQTRASLDPANGDRKVKLLSGAEQNSILVQILESEFGQSIRALWSLPIETLKLPSFLSELRDLVAVCQQHDVQPETIIEIASASKKPVLVAAGRILGEYRSHLNRISGYDAQSLVRVATAALQANSSQFRNLGWVLLDDAQDFTSTELGLIAQLAKDAELEIFADPDATVLGFRAAAPEDLVQILGHSRDIERFDISASVSRQSVLAEAMQRVAQRLPTALAGKQRASLIVRKSTSEEAFFPGLPAASEFPSETSLQLRIFDSLSAEADFLADAIRLRRLESGLQWSDIAVVGRTRAQLDQLTNSLSQHGIPVNVQAAQTPLAKFGIAGDLLDFVADVHLLPKTGVQGLEQLLNSRLSKIDSLDVRALRRRLSVEPEGYQVAIASLVLESEFGEVKGPFASKARKFGRLIALAQGAEGMTPHELVSKIWKSSGLESSLVADSAALSEVGFAAQRDLDSMVELVAAANRFSDSYPESNALQFIRYQREMNVVEDSLVSQSSIDSVQILTPAGLLARRFKLIFAPRLQEGIWPNLRPRNSLLHASSLDAYFRGNSADPVAPMRSELAQELRMFYKMLGASDSAIVLSAVQLNDESPSQFLNLVRPDLPAPAGYRREFDIRARVAQFRRQLNSGSSAAASALGVLARVGAPGAHPTSWYSNIEYEGAGAIDQPETGPTVSPSQLEKFLQCPLHWFISSYGGEGRGFEASIGTLLHEALEIGEPSFEGLWQVVESKWGQLNSSDSWQGLVDRRKAISMVRAMAEYLKEIETQAVTTVEREQKLSAEISGVKIRGTLDRLERLADGTLRIVDLKTGQVGTKSEVAKNLQLGLYQILVEHNYPDSRVAGARILSVKDGVAKKLEQPPLDSVFRERISELLERAKREFPGPSFEAHPDQHCNEAGSVCSILLSPELSS